MIPSNRSGQPTPLVSDDRWGLAERPSGCNDPNEGLSVNFDDVYEYIIKAAVEKVNNSGSGVVIASQRGEDLKSAGSIPHQLIQQVCTADITVTDVTTLNANVFFEYGIRLAVKDPLNILICHEGAQLPFDISELRCIYYTLGAKESNRARDDVAHYILGHLEHLRNDEGDKSLPSYYRYIKLATGKQADHDLIQALEGAPTLIAKLAEPLLKSKMDPMLKQAVFDFFNSVGEVLAKHPQGQRRAIEHYKVFSQIEGLSREKLQETYHKLWSLCSADDALKEEAQEYLKLFRGFDEE